MSYGFFSSTCRPGRPRRARPARGGDIPSRDGRREASPPRPASKSQGGFALLVALLALVGLTALATGGFVLAHSDSRMSTGYQAAVDGFYLADAGLKNFLGTQTGVPEASVTYDFPEGTAEVSSQLLLGTGDGHDMYRIRSRGVPASPNEEADRQVQVMMMLDPLVIDLPGAFLSAGELIKSGTSGTISGEDAATESDCPEGGQADRPAVYAESYDGPTSSPPLYGSDPLVETETDPLSSVDIPWADLLAGTLVDYDYTVNSSGSDDITDADWPDVPSGDWPVIRVDQPDSPDQDDEVILDDTCCSGQGLLIVEENVQLEGSFDWDGIILVGGALRSSGNNTIRGGVATGLNELLGETVPASDIGSGNKTFQYDSCLLLDATQEAGKLVEVPGSWRETL